jgi:hypothetical protein
LHPIRSCFQHNLPPKDAGVNNEAVQKKGKKKKKKKTPELQKVKAKLPKIKPLRKTENDDPQLPVV